MWSGEWGFLLLGLLTPQGNSECPQSPALGPGYLSESDLWPGRFQATALRLEASTKCSQDSLGHTPPENPASTPPACTGLSSQAPLWGHPNPYFGTFAGFPQEGRHKDMVA